MSDMSRIFEKRIQNVRFFHVSSSIVRGWTRAIHALDRAAAEVVLMQRIRSIAAMTVLSIAVSGCSALSGRCLYESRNVVAPGSVLVNSSDSAYATLSAHEQRDYQPDKDFTWQILGPVLKGHVQSIELYANTAASSPSYAFPLHPATIPALSTGFVRKSEGADIDGLFDVLSRVTAVLRITTDIPGKATVVIPLQRVQREDWSRPYCS
jgi:hypothetical protein